MSIAMRRVRDYLELVRFSHTLFALPFALLGAVLAAWGPNGLQGRPRDWLGILLCMATARSAAMAFNRLVDRHYDAQNPRTAGRHLPAGLLSPSAVALFTLICAGGFCSLDFDLFTQPLAALAISARPALADGVFIHEAISPAWRTSGWACP